MHWRQPRAASRRCAERARISWNETQIGQESWMAFQRHPSLRSTLGRSQFTRSRMKTPLHLDSTLFFLFFS